MSGVLCFTLPEWLRTIELFAVYPTLESRMGLAIALARRNVEEGTGGPFGAAVFELESHRLVAVGANIVERTAWSCGHAEIIALSLAQQTLGTYDLGASGLPGYELASSAEPCAMCLGATAWSGVRRLLCGARDADARAIGFDEGPKPADWVEQLERRGIRVVGDVLRDEARAVLALYQSCGGTLYNPTRCRD